MVTTLVKRSLLVGGAIVTVLLLTIGVHIYMVTSPAPLTADTRGIIRINFKQDITNDDATKITNWLYQQRGVENVMCNSEHDFAVAIIHPAAYDPDMLVGDLQSRLNYRAIRFIPTEKQLSNGCPVATSSWTYKIYKYFSHI